MRFLKGVGFFIVVLFFVFVLMFFIGKFSVGDVIWEPGDVGNCGDPEILALWDDVFIESNVGVVILKEFVSPEGDCERYIAYKNDSNGVLRFVYGFFWENSWASTNDSYNSGKKILNSRGFNAFYINTSSSVVENFEGQSDILSMVNYVLLVGDGDLVDWSINNEPELKNMYNSLYEFVDVAGVSFVDGGSSFDYNEFDDESFNYTSLDISGSKTESIFGVDYFRVNYDPDFFVDFSGRIDDFRFLINSSWNFAFDYGDYFDVGGDISVGFDYVGVGNDNGEKINYSIEGTNVSFMPAVNFSGGVVFRLVAQGGEEDVFSNNFTVNITRDNEAPELIDPIPNFYVMVGGNDSVDLVRHFDDEDNLTYGTSGVVGFDVSFSGSVVSVSVDSNFSGYRKFRIYASDGLDITYSNIIYVIEGVEGVDLAPDVNTSVDNEGVSGDIGNESGVVAVRVGGDDSDDEGRGVGFWVILGVIALVLIGGVVFFVYFFILKKSVLGGGQGVVGGQGVAPGGGQPPIAPSNISPADEYVRRLRLGSNTPTPRIERGRP
jgi:hypothetical protein